MSKRYIVVAVALALTGFAPASSQMIAPTTPGIQVEAMTGVFGTAYDSQGRLCEINDSTTGLCYSAAYIYSTYEPVEVAPFARCDHTTVMPADSGWNSGSGNCEILNSSGGVGYDETAVLSLGSNACAGFRLGFDWGSAGNIYYHVLPDIGGNIRFGRMTGYIFSEVGPITDADTLLDRYEIYLRLEGNATSPTGNRYRVTLQLHGDAIGQGSCLAGDTYSDWTFAVSGSGSIRKI